LPHWEKTTVTKKEHRAETDRLIKAVNDRDVLLRNKEKKLKLQKTKVGMTRLKLAMFLNPTGTRRHHRVKRKST
jgi:signal transduction histidine kinase